MFSIVQLLTLIKVFIFAIIILLSLVYSISIFVIRRFHHRSNIVTLNLCLALICCSVYWLIYCILLEYYPNYLFATNICTFFLYAQMMCTCQLAFAFIMIPINRFFSIVYHTKLFFKTKLWIIICVVTQWILGFVISLPLILEQFSDCNRPYWTSVYRLVMIVVIPSMISLCVNSFLFIYIRSSVRHVQCQSQIRQTNIDTTYQPRIGRHDIRLLRYMIHMFCIFNVGWGPVFLLISIDHQGNVSPIIYIIFAFIAEASLLSIIINLFRYNHKLIQYLKNRILQRC